MSTSTTIEIDEVIDLLQSIKKQRLNPSFKNDTPEPLLAKSNIKPNITAYETIYERIKQKQYNLSEQMQVRVLNLLDKWNNTKYDVFVEKIKAHNDVTGDGNIEDTCQYYEDLDKALEWLNKGNGSICNVVMEDSIPDYMKVDETFKGKTPRATNYDGR